VESESESAFFIRLAPRRAVGGSWEEEAPRQRARRGWRGRSQAGDARRQREALHRGAERIVGDARGRRRRPLERCTLHVVRQEREADLVCGCGRNLHEVKTGKTRGERRTVHPAEPFARNHLESTP
jgi:hypothetical protein